MTQYTYDVRFTRNMGNYESLQIVEGITEDAREGETVDQVRDRVKEKVNLWIFEDIEDVERDIRGLRSRLDAEEAAG